MSGENKTWRERIAAAKARGWFTRNDVADAASYRTCKVGETGAHLMAIETPTESIAWAERMAAPLRSWDEECDGIKFWRAVKKNDVAEAERLADAIEDRALELKRASGASQPEGLRP